MKDIIGIVSMSQEIKYESRKSAQQATRSILPLDGTGTYLLVLDLTGDDHLAVQISRTGCNHLHLDLAIIDEEDVTNLTRLDDFGMGQQNALVGAGSFVQIEPKDLTGLQPLSVGVGEGSDAELGTLQIAQDGNGMVILGLDLTDDVEQLLLLCVFAMGEVETENVSAGEE